MTDEKSIIELGYDLTVEHPEIADKYREGKNLLEIAESIRDNGFRDYSRADLESAVRYSLRGNHRKDLGTTFMGLMLRGEYDKIARGESREEEEDSKDHWEEEEIEHLRDLKEDGFTSYIVMARLINLVYHISLIQ